MSILYFDKYHGTGNDFVIFDGIKQPEVTQLSVEQIAKICNRRFGIGADGLMVVNKSSDFDFRMMYFNADGHEGSFCGNGSRCIVRYANERQYCSSKVKFIASDGPHLAEISGDIVSMKMSDVHAWEKGRGYYTLDTGSPHYVAFVEDISDLDIKEQGKAIRYSSPFAREGINVNFVERRTEHLHIATYERGVEDETFSCGTGVTASCIAHAIDNQLLGDQRIAVKTKGGSLEVTFFLTGHDCTDVFLNGPAEKVFSGTIEA